jgi:hypothetical protein
VEVLLSVIAVILVSFVVPYRYNQSASDTEHTKVYSMHSCYSALQVGCPCAKLKWQIRVCRILATET